MKILICYFSGTGNTKRVVDKFAECLEENENEVTLQRVEHEFNLNIEDFDLIGFGYPVHAFNAPEIILDFVKKLKKLENKKDVFIINTSGEPLKLNNIVNAKRKTPFLGICLGLQLLFERSDEAPGVEGLGILKGEILKIPEQEGMKIPHMGWNSLHLEHDGRLFRGIGEGAYVYFVHSYYLKAEDEEIVKASTEYCTHIHASVEKDNVFACQFHPEKSSDVGLHILKNFVEL